MRREIRVNGVKEVKRVKRDNYYLLSFNC